LQLANLQRFLAYLLVHAIAATGLKWWAVLDLNQRPKDYEGFTQVNEVNNLRDFLQRLVAVDAYSLSASSATFAPHHFGASDLPHLQPMGRINGVLVELVWVARALTFAKNASAPTPGRFTFRRHPAQQRDIHGTPRSPRSAY
jgi:hypothetical protein